MSKTPLSDIYGGAQNFLQLQGRYLHLKYARSVTDLASRSLVTIIKFVLGAVAIIFFSLALALWFGRLLESLPAGFACVGAFYLITLVVWSVLSSKKTANIKDAIVRELAVGVSTYDELVYEQTQIKPKLDAEKENLQQKLLELKLALADIEEKFGGRVDKSSDADTPRQQVGNRIMSTAVNVLLDAFVLPKVGIVKRAVIPMVANAVMRSRFFKSGKLAGLISRIKGKG
jgi:hypothetical protein